MDRLQTFKGYFLLFVSFFLAMSLLTYGMTIRPHKDLKHEITFESPKLVVSGTQTGYSHGYIKGEITNDTGEMINVKYLKFEFYNEKGTYLGTKYKELKNFYEKETMKIEMEYNYRNVDTVRISLSDEQVQRELTGIEKEIVRWWPVIGVGAFIYYILPMI